ncbi:MAG TPA: TraR/DksA C4-type zinc finger protein [Actinomycetota bacterium]|nr:TraR/DksA C4-type zinc finger protein [Actinomycetota bacterium]
MDNHRAAELLDHEEERLSGLRHTTELESLAAGSEMDSISEIADYDQHPGDVATETFEREKRLSILETVEAGLADVAAARARLKAGTYGICEACGRAIGDERLAAQPATRFCLEDQEKAEIRH